MLELMADICMLRLVTWNCKSLTAVFTLSKLAVTFDIVTFEDNVAKALVTEVLFDVVVELVAVELAACSGAARYG